MPGQRLPRPNAGEVGLTPRYLPECSDRDRRVGIPRTTNPVRTLPLEERRTLFCGGGMARRGAVGGTPARGYYLQGADARNTWPYWNVPQVFYLISG